jgi:EamA-like transporter family.
MSNALWPLLLIVGANTFYNICAKSTPSNMNPFAALSLTYCIATLLCLFMFFVTNKVNTFFTELSNANWTSIALGISIVALEFGYIHIYRASWKVGTASLVANIILAFILLCIGFALYKEHIVLRQIIGILLCSLGLLFISK